MCVCPHYTNQLSGAGVVSAGPMSSEGEGEGFTVLIGQNVQRRRM